MFNSCEGLHDGFRAITKGYGRSMCKVLVSAKKKSFEVVFFYSFLCSAKNLHVFLQLLTKLMMPVRPNRSVCSYP